MNTEQPSSFETLQQIRLMMERSARFLSLSGWSGVWAGVVALLSAAIVHYRLGIVTYDDLQPGTFLMPLTTLGLGTFILAFAGAFYFTYRKNKREAVVMWNHASRRMLLNLAIPLAAGAVIIIAFVLNGHWQYLMPATLIFYGLALINGSKYTISDIKYLGLVDIILGCIALFIAPGYGLYIWALGFGVLHIVYGMLMWRK